MPNSEASFRVLTDDASSVMGHHPTISGRCPPHLAAQQGRFSVDKATRRYSCDPLTSATALLHSGQADGGPSGYQFQPSP